MGEKDEPTRKPLTAKDREHILMAQVLEIKALKNRLDIMEKSLKVLVEHIDHWFQPGVN